MIRVTTLLWVLLLIVAGGTVMRVSYRVRHVQEHLADLRRDIQREQDSIRVLNAEWSTLNDPQRIDGLSKHYLTLGSTPIQRVVRLEDIPLKPSPEQLAQMAAQAKGGKTRPPPKVPVAAPRSTPPSAAPPGRLGPLPPTGQGLILARAERHE